jgi:uncharacterized protein (TIGR02246 family)
MNTIRHAADARSKIDAANRDFAAAFVRKDPAAVSALYTRDGQLLPPDSDFVIGRPAIARYWQEAMKIGVRKLETTELEVHGEVAVEAGRYTVEASEGATADAGMYIVIWKREDGHWRMHRDVWSRQAPAHASP